MGECSPLPGDVGEEITAPLRAADNEKDSFPAIGKESLLYAAGAAPQAGEAKHIGEILERCPPQSFAGKIRDRHQFKICPEFCWMGMQTNP